jgi:hypothetical protein
LGYDCLLLPFIITHLIRRACKLNIIKVINESDDFFHWWLGDMKLQRGRKKKQSVAPKTALRAICSWVTEIISHKPKRVSLIHSLFITNRYIASKHQGRRRARESRITHPVSHDQSTGKPWKTI